jgi:hypothetical protein
MSYVIWIRVSIHTLLDASKETGPEVNPEKTRYTSMLVSRCQKAELRQSTKIGNRSFEDMANFKCLGIVIMKRLT